MNLRNEFAGIFYNDSIEVIKITRGTGYDRSERLERLCTLKGDLQPYGGGLAQREYGLTIECNMRLFCDENEHIKVGNHIEVNGLRYRIEYVANRGLGMYALLKGVESDE